MRMNYTLVYMWVLNSNQPQGILLLFDCRYVSEFEISFKNRERKQDRGNIFLCLGR